MCWLWEIFRSPVRRNLIQILPIESYVIYTRLHGRTIFQTSMSRLQRRCVVPISWTNLVNRTTVLVCLPSIVITGRLMLFGMTRLVLTRSGGFFFRTSSSHTGRERQACRRMLHVPVYFRIASLCVYSRREIRRVFHRPDVLPLVWNRTEH